MRSTFCLRIRVKGRTRGSGARSRGAGDAGPGGSAHNATLTQPKKRRRRAPRPAETYQAPRAPATGMAANYRQDARAASGGGYPGVDAALGAPAFDSGAPRTTPTLETAPTRVGVPLRLNLARGIGRAWAFSRRDGGPQRSLAPDGPAARARRGLLRAC
jgi:hypothetical protein